jgi:predicted NACHT family NTPase
VELEQIYITLRAQSQRSPRLEEEWLARQAALALGEERRLRLEKETGEEPGAGDVSVEQALAASRHLVVLGDPGSGKTTLLRYLALLYARDLAEGKGQVKARLGLDEGGFLPVFLPLRRLNAFLQQHKPVDDGADGYELVLRFISESLAAENIKLPEEFFLPYLASGRAVLLLDGLDEVADPELRRRVSRLVQSFARAYSQCRFVVTSRVVGYIATVRLEDDFALPLCAILPWRMCALS